jgi:transcriptional regulator with XRE-family HTH domain
VDTDLRHAVGRRVRECRTELRLSQESLAERANLHRNYIGSIERGERDMGVNALARLADALGMSLAEFFRPFSGRRLR